MSYYVGLPLFVAVALLQVAAMPSLSLAGVSPDILLIFTACWATIRGQKQAMLLVPFAAFVNDLLAGNPVGASIIALAPLVLLASERYGRPTTVQLVPTLLVVALGTLAYHLVFNIVMFALGYDVPWVSAFSDKWLPAVVVNAVLTPAFYLPLWWASWDLRRQTALISWRT